MQQQNHKQNWRDKPSRNLQATVRLSLSHQPHRQGAAMSQAFNKAVAKGAK